MNFREYQKQAIKTSQTPDLIVPLLGLAGETGELLSEYKKHLRDGEAHRLFKERIEEELGDILWYIADVASKFDLDLGEVAQTNLQKSQDRWGTREKTNADPPANSGNYFDRDFPDNERLPRQFKVEITEFSQNDSVKMKAFVDGRQIGNDLSDNSYLQHFLG
ncbi:MAG: nucleoside triphosphate pyrophosphohydrolase family protein [Microcoleaceae cyanobacterium]